MNHSFEVRRSVALIAAIAMVGWLAPWSLAAQETTEFQACYVPEVGAMYLINLPGLPTDCLSENHEPVSWRDGEGLGPGSVTSEHLAPRSVTSESIENGAVDSRTLAPGAVGAQALADNAVTPGKLAPGAVSAAALAGNAVERQALAPGAVSGLHLDLGLHWYTATQPDSWGPLVSRSIRRSCPNGERVLAGGWVSSGSNDLSITGSWALNRTTWQVTGRNRGQSEASVRLVLLCGNVPVL